MIEVWKCNNINEQKMVLLLQEVTINSGTAIELNKVNIYYYIQFAVENKQTKMILYISYNFFIPLSLSGKNNTQYLFIS